MSSLTLHSAFGQGHNVDVWTWTWCSLVHAKRSCWCFHNSEQIFSAILTSFSNSFSRTPASFVFPGCLIEFTPFLSFATQSRANTEGDRAKLGCGAYLPPLISACLKASGQEAWGKPHSLLWSFSLSLPLSICWVYLHWVGGWYPKWSYNGQTVW